MRLPGFLLLIAIFILACQPKTEQQTSGNETDTPAVTYDCAHCGMPSKEFPEWNTRITTAEGEQWTCSPRCMLILTKKDKPMADAQIAVVDYYNQQMIDGKTAFYVIKSQQTGPMGHDFVPLQTAEAAQEFLNDYAGDRILRYEEITPDVIEEVVRYKPAP
ncbi:MAG: nitrous oxide reductase accessory protein NosL [Bernardetiaceae bacterium]